MRKIKKAMKKKIKEDSTPGVALGTTIIIIVMALVFGALFVFMYSKDMLFLPSFVEELFGLDEKENELPWDIGALLEIVKSGKDDSPESVVLDVSYESLRDAFLCEKEADGLFLNSRITYYSDGDSVWHNVKYYRHGEKFRAEIFPSDSDSIPSIIKAANEEQIKYTDVASNVSSVIMRADGISSENEAGIPSVDDLLSVVALFPKKEEDNSGLSNISTNDYTPEISDVEDDNSTISDCSLKLVHLGDDNVYYIGYTNSESQIREEYYVLLEYRIIIFSTAKNADGDFIYSYEVTDFSTDSEIYNQDSLYEIS